MPCCSLAYLPDRSFRASPGGMRAQEAVNRSTVRPSGIPSGTVVTTVFLRSVPAFLPGSALWIPRSSGNVREQQGTPLKWEEEKRAASFTGC
jgi:hypothetical protein